MIHDVATLITMEVSKGVCEKNVNDYLVKINWRGELLEFYTTAATDKLALVNACHQLATKIMWRPLAVFTDVYNKQNSYSVTIRPKKEQV